MLLGKILIAGGFNSSAFVSDGTLIFNGGKLWKANCAVRGRLVESEFGGVVQLLYA